MFQATVNRILNTFGLTRLYQVKALEERLRKVEQRLYNRRWAAIEELGDYLVCAEIPGDYCEFGIYRGNTLGYAERICGPAMPHMRFFGFDSFQGLPKPQGIDAVDDYTSHFTEGQFAAPQDEVLAHMRGMGVDLSKIVLVPGWFDQSLTDDNVARYGVDKVAAAWIDCDLYESTVPVLDFLTKRLVVGSIILFDDWRSFRNLPDFGEQKACREWLERNPQITLREWYTFGHHGMAFSVASC